MKPLSAEHEESIYRKYEGLILGLEKRRDSLRGSKSGESKMMSLMENEEIHKTDEIDKINDINEINEICVINESDCNACIDEIDDEINKISAIDDINY